jgi:hypothetical protein
MWLGEYWESIDERKWCAESLEKAKRLTLSLPRRTRSPLLSLFRISKAHLAKLGLCLREIALTFDNIFHRGGVSENL